ncbi:MAG: chloride channel protein [Desulfofustis sp.]
MTFKKTALSKYLDQLAPPVGLLLLILSIAIGAGTGLAAVLFIKLIYAIQYLSYETLPELLPKLGNFVYFIIPVIGGLLVGPLILFAKEAKGHGVPEVMQALIIRGGRIRARVAAAKIMASALCIGTGGSAGREGPIVQVGSALGSSIGQVLRLSDDRIRNLVGCGAAAGIAATFNAPIAGVVFAIKVLMGNLVSPISLVFYLLLGLLSALVGIMFIRMLSRAEDIFDNWDFPQLLKPAVGAALLGVTGMMFMYLPGSSGLIMPYMYGSGFHVIEQVMLENVPFWILFLLIFLKPLATSFTLGSGNSGGVFAPSLFIGAMLGGCLGLILERFFPEVAGGSGAYALVGMAALFGATARAPLTAMLIVFEMSNDYLMILPLMVAGISATYFAQWLHPESIYTLKLAKRGIRFFEGRDMDIMQGVNVEEVMRTRLVTIHKDKSVSELMALFQETNLLGFPVVTEGNRLWGIITLQDVHRAQSLDGFNPRDMKVSDLAIEGPISVFPDEPIWVAIQKMSPRDLARLPVISRDGSMRLLGSISRSDILRAYDVGIVRKQRGQLEEKEITLRSATETGFLEMVINEDSVCSNELVKDLPLPENVTLVSIKRGSKMIIPRGRHQIKAGDVLTLFGQLDEIDQLKNFMR